MSPASNSTRTETNLPPACRESDLVELARDLVDKVGIDGAASYCRSLGWGGVLRQVDLLRDS